MPEKQTTPGERDETGESEKAMSKEEQKKLFAEWRKDYAARREEDRLAREGVPTAGPPETWPSEIARANRHKQAGQDHGNSSGNEKAEGKDGGHSL